MRRAPAFASADFDTKRYVKHDKWFSSLGHHAFEEAIVEIRVALSKSLKRMRQQEQLSQQKLAEKTNSSQSRVAKMEAADRSVSIDPPIWTKITLVAEGR